MKHTKCLPHSLTSLPYLLSVWSRPAISVDTADAVVVAGAVVAAVAAVA